MCGFVDKLRLISCVALVAIMSSCLLAANYDGAAASASSGSGTSKATAGTKAKGRDPVALAFALPTGTASNSSQQKAYNKLKSQNISALRAALNSVAQNKEGGQRTKAIKEVHDLRAKIKTGIQQILAMPAADAQRRAMSAYESSQRYSNPRPQSGSSGCPCGR